MMTNLPNVQGFEGEGGVRIYGTIPLPDVHTQEVTFRVI